MIWLGKEINTCHSFYAAKLQITGEMPHIYCCACRFPYSLPPWCPLMQPLIAPSAPFDETISRNSGLTCSLLPPWRPLMKPSIVAPVLFDETINRCSGPTPSSLLYWVSFAKLSFAEADSCCFCIKLHVSLVKVVHLEQAMAETAKKKGLHKTFLNPAQIRIEQHSDMAARKCLKTMSGMILNRSSDCNQSLQPNRLQMKCDVWKPCSDQLWQIELPFSIWRFSEQFFFCEQSSTVLLTNHPSPSW